MPATPRGNRNRIILIVIVIVCLTLVTLYIKESDRGPLHKVQNFFVDMVSPISSTFSKVFRPIKDGFVNLFHLPSLSKQKADLQREVSTLHRQQVETKELEAQVEELKNLLNWAQQHPDYETVGADIVGLSPDNWQRQMIVNKGTSDGVKKYMAVVTDEGLAGRIIAVGSNSSVVQLITDSRSGIGVRDLNNRETGVVDGRNEETLRFEPMNEDSVTKVGDGVETSGLGGTCPSGIAVGEVSKVQNRSKGMTRLVEVKPFVKFSKLDKVLIIIMPEPEQSILKEAQ